MSAGGFELLGHEFMDRVYERFWKVAPANAGLVGYHNYGQLCVVQTAYGVRYAWQDTKSADVIQVADFFGDGAVAIEENGGAERAGVRQGAPPSTKSNVARRLRRRRESRGSCTGDLSGIGAENRGCNTVFLERCCNAA